jgi:aminopeptidase N
VNHISIDLSLDFDKKVVRGWALHECLDGETIELDTRDLEISSVEDDADGEFEAIDFRLGDEDPIEGRKLRIEPREGALHIRVHYESSPEAPGLQWLAASQTKDGKAPFVYSQGQSNHNRSWLPCVDDPAQRITFDATLRVPGGIRAVMAAQDDSDPDEAGVFRFQMPQPIPSYLIAMAAGVLEFRSLGERAGVWAEPSLVEACAHEFADTESMIAATERLFGAYRWGRYDLLVLPPSFPLGGMENPRLTFATPTILAGDRSLVSLVAHELAHSWSGNLVTNETWDDFWLNEGFTVYIERRILEAVYGRERSEMEASIGRQRLEACIEELGVDSPDTCLHLNLAGREPDSAMTDVPY